MRKGLTEIVFILDRSGSMSGLEADTIGGFNGLIEKQKKEEGEAYVSVVLFDDETEVLYDRVDIKKIEPMNDRQYYVRGCTALLDAVGGAIHHIKNVHRYAREEDVPEKTLFIITTDGMENASKMYSYSKVKKMVEHEKKKYNWEFLFLGANIDAVQVANQFGVKANRAVRFHSDEMGTELNYNIMSHMVSCARSAKSAMDMECVFDNDRALDEIREDYEDYEAAKNMKNSVEDVTDMDKVFIEGVLHELSKRERDIAELIYGLKGKKALAYDDVAAMLGLPGGRVRQVASKIRRKLVQMRMRQ